MRRSDGSDDRCRHRDHEARGTLFERRVNDAVSKGAEVLTASDRQGALFRRRWSTTSPMTCELVHEETFGPVIPIMRVPQRHRERDPDFELDRVRPVLGRLHQPLDYITRFVDELDVGTVNVWEVPGYRIEMSPFGGIKDSGLGYKEGVQEAMKSFTNVKTWSLPWPA
jgi:acyl-CoA reductase-like NAD-dependent aldehyde dehydrogenase